MREEKYLDQHENHSENKEHDDFPTCEPRQIMPKKKERTKNRRNDPGPCRARDFELQIRTEDSAKSNNGASAVIQNAMCSNPVGSIVTMLPLSPAFLVRSAIESATPSASSGLLLIFS